MDSLFTIVRLDEGIYIQTTDFIYLYKGNEYQQLYSFYNGTNDKSINELVTFLDLFWLITEGSPNNSYVPVNIPYIENLVPIYGSFSNGILVDKQELNYIAEHTYAKEKSLIIGTLTDDKPKYKLPSNILGNILQYKDKFIVRGRNNDSALICLDSTLSEVWRTPLKSSQCAMRGLPCSPEIYQDIVYVNMPEDPVYQPATQPKKIPMDIGAFSADTGEPIWKDTLPCNTRNADLHGSEVFIACDYFIQIRDVKTGKVIWEMAPFWAEDEIPNLLYPLNEQDLLLNFQFKNKALILNRTDKSIKQVITLPEKSYYCFGTTDQPIKVSDTQWLWTVEFTNPIANARNSGVVTIDLDNNQTKEHTAQIKPRPNYTLKGKKMEHGEKEYFLDMSHHDLDEVIRYCIIVIKNFAFEKGRYGFPTKPDRKHNGKIHVAIDRASLDTDKSEQELLSALATIKKATEDKFSVSRLKAGNNKNEFDVRIQLV